MSAMPMLDEEIKLFVKQIVREDFIGLYGFDSVEELDMFNLLLATNGVGAKAALSLLSISRINNLKYAIVMGDEKHLCKAPGIGKKTAGRIILEISDKLKKENKHLGTENSDFANILLDESTNNITEALGALLSLGYSEKEAEVALKKIDKTETLENIIKSSLKVLMG